MNIPWIVSNWKLLAWIAFTLGIFAFGISVGSDRVQQKWDKEKAEIAAEHLRAVKQNAEIIRELGVKHDKDQTEIDRLAADNRRLRLRLPSTPCGGPDTAGAGTGKTPGDGALPKDPQQAIDRYTDGVGELMHEADTVVNDCRVVMDWAKRLRR